MYVYFLSVFKPKRDGGKLIGVSYIQYIYLYLNVDMGFLMMLNYKKLFVSDSIRILPKIRFDNSFNYRFSNIGCSMAFLSKYSNAQDIALRQILHSNFILAYH